MDNINWGDLLFGFSGRINRAKYWLAVAICIAASVVVSILGLFLGSTIGSVLSGAASLATLIIGIAISIKRLHDRDKSAWWLLLFMLAPGVLLGFGILTGALGMIDGGGGGIGWVLSLAGIAIGIWGFVELGCLRGSIGPNRYGPDPLGGDLVMAQRV